MTSPNNDETIEIYEQNFADYLKLTPATYQKNHTPLLRWLNTTLAILPTNAKILEIGSGTGREASYLHSKGFDVVASDVVKGFVAHLKKQGHDTLLLNALKDPIPRGYDLILMNAVAPHFTDYDLRSVLAKFHRALKPGGILAFSVKQGKGEDWVNEKFHQKRYVHYWEPDMIKEVVTKADFTICFCETDIPGDLAAHKWINISATKQ